MGNLQSRADRTGEIESAARQASSEQAAAELEHAPPEDGWQSQVYVEGRPAEGDEQPPARCARLRLDAGSGAVTIKVVSWLDAMKAKMAAGR